MCVKHFGIVTFAGAVLILLGVTLGFIGEAHAEDSPDGLSDIPSVLITYKYAPEKLSDEILKNSLRYIIDQEQMYYKYITDAKKQNHKSPYEDSFFLFTEDQVAGRAANFATEDLLEEYKTFLSKEAAAIPDQVRLDHYLRVGYFKYENGVINSNTRSGQGSDVFFRYSIENERKKASISTLGSRELFMGTYNLKAKVNLPGFAKLPSRYGQLQLAIDRVPIIPPVAMLREEAEKLFIRPEIRQECGEDLSSPFGFKAWNQPDLGPEVVAKHQSCAARIRRYSNGFRLSFMVTPEGFVEGTNILALRLNKVELYNPYGDLMKTFLHSDLPPAIDAFTEQKVAEENAAREKAARKQAEAKAKATMRTKIGASDIDGVTLSMSYSEAELTVRAKLEIGRVRELKSIQRTNPFFNDMSQFENIDGSERIMLFRAKPNSEKLVGIGRWLNLPKGTTIEDVKDQLIAKYGEPTDNFFSHGLTWHGYGEEKACALSIGWVRAPAIKEGETLDGGYEQYGSFSVSPTYAVSGKSKNDVLNDLRDKCSPQLFVLVQMSRLLVVLLDIPAFATENIDKNESKEVELDL